MPLAIVAFARANFSVLSAPSSLPVFPFNVTNGEMATGSVLPPTPTPTTTAAVELALGRMARHNTESELDRGASSNGQWGR